MAQPLTRRDWATGVPPAPAPQQVVCVHPQQQKHHTEPGPLSSAGVPVTQETEGSQNGEQQAKPGPGGLERHGEGGRGAGPGSEGQCPRAVARVASKDRGPGSRGEIGSGRESHLVAMSSSSPPQPQYSLGKPFIFRYWSGVSAETPPKYWGYGRLGRERALGSTVFRIHPYAQSHPLPSSCGWFPSMLSCLLPVAKLVHGDGHVPWAPGVTHVQVVVVLWQEVHIVQEQTVPLLIPQGLPHPDIEQLRPVKGPVSRLKDTNGDLARSGAEKKS